MKLDVKVPAVGESITEATIAAWLKPDGSLVKRNDILLSLETDKATVEVSADGDGVLKISTPAGTVVKIGAVIASIDSDGKATAVAATSDTPPASPVAAAPVAANPAPAASHDGLSPAVRRVVAENNLNPNEIAGSGKDGRITKSDAENAIGKTAAAPAVSAAPVAAVASAPAGGIRRVPMTTIRRRIAERLVEAQHTAAILTTFNECDMTGVLNLREKYKDKFKERYGVSLGFMGFFVKACIEGLRAYPAVNASIEGTDIMYKDFYNIGVAVGTEKGLIVPVIKNADQLTLAEIELAIKDFGGKAKLGKISVADLSGGSFTISNGGVYGSLMSTPILNPPQSGILGMHKIQERPVAIGKQIEIRPMMYLALSYDHRMIDGKEAVSFLVKVKECIEDPTRIFLEV
jgi:2-oxoglutarate dehydrogenase E2 component (dihydrolipoamide succinyltransferase)